MYIISCKQELSDNNGQNKNLHITNVHNGNSPVKTKAGHVFLLIKDYIIIYIILYYIIQKTKL